MSFHDIEQNSEAWRQIRCGRVTASRVADVIAKTAKGWAASRANYMAELIVERLTGIPTEGFTNAAMQWGSDKESDARAAYEYLREVDVDQVGFVEHPTIAMSGASPDGLIGTAGLLEIKCPNTATHIETLLGQSVPGKYITQIQWQLACTGRDYCDFLSYDPRLPEPMQTFICRVDRDPGFIAETEKLVIAFIAEMEGKITILNQKFKEAA